MPVEPERTDESRRFEAGLQRLLKQAYQPPEPSEAFRGALLERMKRKQAEVVTRHRRRTRIRRVVFASGVTAAAASVAIAFSGLLGAPTAVQEGTGAPSPAHAAAERPSHDDATTRNLVHVAQSSSPETMPTVARLPADYQARVLGRLLVREGEGPYHTVQNTLTVQDGCELRAVHEQAGIELAPGARLVLEKGSAVELAADGVRVRHGLVSLRLAPDAEGVDLRLPEHTIQVAPGGWVGLQLARADRYADGGRPAPDVTLMEGAAAIRTDDGEVAMLPRRTYRLHAYPSLDRLEGEALDEQRLRRSREWVEPVLVNFQTSGR
ncbi:MAG: hypothetical protein ACOCX4_00940 [Planctomycetota bacterium]